MMSYILRILGTVAFVVSGLSFMALGLQMNNTAAGTLTEGLIINAFVFVPLIVGGLLFYSAEKIEIKKLRGK